MKRIWKSGAEFDAEHRKSVISKLYVRVRGDESLVGFPLLNGQYVESVEYSEDDSDNAVVVINLGDRTDTTVLQEQYLDTSSATAHYLIRRTTR